MSQYSTSEIIKSSLENVNKLKDELKNISKIREGVQANINNAKRVVSEFDVYKDNINEVSNQYIERNAELLQAQIILFQEKIIDLNHRIERIDNIDFQRRFQNISEEFISELNSKVTTEIEKFNEVRSDFELVKTDFIKSVEKIENVDLENHFRKHDQRLSEIFNAINNINSTILNISNHLNTLNNKLDDLSKQLLSLREHFNSELKIVANNVETQSDYLKKLSEDIGNNFTKSNNLTEELHNKLKKQILTVNILLIILIILNIVFYIIK